MRTVLIGLVGLAAGCSSAVGESEVLAIMDDARDMQAAEDVLREVFEAFADFDDPTSLRALPATIEEYWTSEVPCGDTSREGEAIVIDYGSIDEKCTWRGTALGGLHQVTVRSVDPAELSLRHSFTDYTNGVISITGETVVNWSAETLTREVSFDYFWTNADGRTREVIGVNTYGIVDSQLGLRSTVTLDGNRWWGDDDGSVSQELVGVAYQLADPVPEAGQWDFTVNRTEIVSMLFSRIDTSTYRVDVEGALRPYSWRVNQQGEVGRFEAL